jgi:hypothetical protein
MKTPRKNRGQWLSLFYLTLSDISADIDTQQMKKAEPFTALPELTLEGKIII